MAKDFAEQSTGPVTIRLGDLENEVASRRRSAVSAGAALKRDLARYYGLLKKAQIGTFSLSESKALVIALGPDFDAAAAPYIWAEIEKQYRQLANDEGAHRWCVLPVDFDPRPLIARLRRLSDTENLALLDRVERYWVLHEGSDEHLFPDVIEEHLISAGLCTKEQVAHAHAEKERNKDRLIVRDLLAGLRDPSEEE